MTAVVILASAACGETEVDEDRPRTSATTEGEADTPYLPDRLLDAPAEPPRLSLVTQLGRTEPRRIAVDWSSRSGPVDERSGRVEWPSARIDAGEPRAEFEFGTSQVPSRVVLYEYAQVGDDGVPDETLGTETVCAFADRTAKCRREGDGAAPARVVVRFGSTGNAYWVIHAAWPVLAGKGSQDGVDVVSASWVVKINRR
ncbi:hypothetical protein [Streptomyces sp. MNU89]|uniref:hypothetical protein n=1 Tax=Streptomyces sp. MNU89 TaxID=2560025 RepID=UPI001E35DD41|nr:hypothetical protein [Streptomyces sp. MNU89]MCC9740959.1 hypothetical protein [Streptomyces sp. MNU89]